MEESYEKCILRAIASNFSMTATFSLAIIFFLHAFTYLPQLVFGYVSKGFYLYSLLKWTMATLLSLSAALRRVERINSVSRFVEQLGVNFFFFFFISSLQLGIFKLFYACSACLGLFRLSFAPVAQQLQCNSLSKQLKKAFSSAEYSKSFFVFILVLTSLHSSWKLLSAFVAFSYEFWVPFQFLYALTCYSFGIVIAVTCQALFLFFFQEKNFRVSPSGVILLDGLTSSNNTVQYFALHELFCIAMYEESKRKRIFHEITGDVVVSREIVTNTTRYFEQASYALESEGKRTKRINDRLQLRFSRSNSGESDIFQKNTSSVLLKFLKFLLQLKTFDVSSKEVAQMSRKSPPSFLKPMDNTKDPKPHLASKSSEGTDLISLLFQSEIFCSLLSLYTTFNETMLLSSYKAPIEYASLGISAFVVASFFEDIHGQVQLALPQLLLAMDRLRKALANYSESASYTPQADMERTVKRSIDAIVERYRESIVSLSEFPSISHLVQ